MKFDDTVNSIINEEWTDPLNQHNMKIDRGANRQNQRWTPKVHQKEPSLSLGQRALDIAKDADSGIWQLSLGQAMSIARKYKFHLPSRSKPIKHLGSTGIVMYYKRVKNKQGYNLYLVKHDEITRKMIKRKKTGQSSSPRSGTATKPQYPTRSKSPKKPKFKRGEVKMGSQYSSDEFKKQYSSKDNTTKQYKKTGKMV